MTLEGDVMGLAMPEYTGEEVVGYGHHHRRGRNVQMHFPPRPAWRNRLAPGVPMPGQRLQPLPLVNPVGAAQFTSTVTTFNMEAKPQRPFQGLRLLTSVRRVGATAAGLTVVTTGFFVGTDIQFVELGQFDIEFFGPTAFDVNLALDPAEPGVLVRLQLALTGGVLTSPDVINVSALVLGHAIS